MNGRLIGSLCRGAALLIGLAVTAGCVTASGSAGRFERLLTNELYSFRYDAEAQRLTVVTRTGDVIEHEGVGADVVAEWRRAEDLDAFYREQITTRWPGRPMDLSAGAPSAP